MLNAQTQTDYLWEEIVFFGNLVQHLMGLNSRADISLQYLGDKQYKLYNRHEGHHRIWQCIQLRCNVHLQTGKKSEQRVHPGARGKQRFVYMDVQKQRRLADVLHYGFIVLNRQEKNRQCF